MQFSTVICIQYLCSFFRAATPEEDQAQSQSAERTSEPISSADQVHMYMIVAPLQRHWYSSHTD